VSGWLVVMRTYLYTASRYTRETEYQRSLQSAQQHVVSHRISGHRLATVGSGRVHLDSRSTKPLTVQHDTRILRVCTSCIYSLCRFCLADFVNRRMCMPQILIS